MFCLKSKLVILEQRLDNWGIHPYFSRTLRKQFTVLRRVVICFLMKKFYCITHSLYSGNSLSSTIKKNININYKSNK